jgi:hypothetical protein
VKYFLGQTKTKLINLCLLKEADVKLKNKMKNLFILLITLIGFAVNSNAQSCPIPGTYESISITSTQNGEFNNSSITHSGCKCNVPYKGYLVKIENPSSKNVSFKITALNSKNIREKIIHCSITGKTRANAPYIYVCFVASDSKDYYIEDYKLEVTSCSN